MQAKTAPSGCTTNAVVRLTDGTTPVNVTIAAAANDSGAITQNYAAGASLTVAVQTVAAGCTTALQTPTSLCSTACSRTHSGKSSRRSVTEASGPS